MGRESVLQLEVPGSITVADLKALIVSELPELQSNPAQQYIYYNGRLLSNALRTLEQLNMKEDDAVVFHAPAASVASSASSSQPQRQAQRPSPQQPRQQQQQQVQQQQPQQRQHDRKVEYDAESVRMHVLANPDLLAQIQRDNPELYDARNDPIQFDREFNRLQEDRARSERIEREKNAEIVRRPTLPPTATLLTPLAKTE